LKHYRLIPNDPNPIRYFNEVSLGNDAVASIEATERYVAVGQPYANSGEGKVSVYDLYDNLKEVQSVKGDWKHRHVGQRVRVAYHKFGPTNTQSYQVFYDSQERITEFKSQLFIGKLTLLLKNETVASPTLTTSNQVEYH
jgi:hypothetical protein